MRILLRAICGFLALQLLLLATATPVRAEGETPTEEQCRVSEEPSKAAIAAGMAMVAAGVALLPDPTTPIGVALIAAGMALIARGMWCQKVFLDASAERAAAEAAAAAKAAAEKAAAEKADAEAKAAEQAEHAVERRLAVVFRFHKYSDCVLGLGERSARASARPILPESYTVESYCRRLFPHEVNAGNEAITVDMRFHFESQEQCVEATAVQMPHADGQVQFASGQTAESYCLELFPQGQHQEDKKDEKQEDKKLDTQKSELDSGNSHAAEVEMDMPAD